MIGWYGTETIGDRAIFAGLIDVLSTALGDNLKINIGSLFPPLTRRTLFEDRDFYSDISKTNIEFDIFYSLSKTELEKNIKRSEFLFVGGGPLMDTPLMYMLYYGIRYAKSKGVKTALLGCGWGPLNNEEYASLTAHMINHSDLSIFRDSKSKSIAQEKTSQLLISVVDPAVFAALHFMEYYAPKEKSDNYTCANFRELYVTPNGEHNTFSMDYCIQTLMDLLDNTEGQLLLVPMHTYHIGGDDRAILNKLFQVLNNDRLVVINKPISLLETMKIYNGASLCVGMRFHSILLQTLLNGRNYVLDYTDPVKGKIVNLLKQFGVEDLYNERYSSWSNPRRLIIKKDVGAVAIDKARLLEFRDIYIEEIKKCLRA